MMPADGPLSASRTILIESLDDVDPADKRSLLVQVERWQRLQLPVIGVECVPSIIGGSLVGSASSS